MILAVIIGYTVRDPKVSRFKKNLGKVGHFGKNLPKKK